MASYVTVPDLIRNGGEGCTVLHQRKPPHTDHLVIVENECNCAYRGSLTITHGEDTIVYRFMRGTDIMDEFVHLTVGDLNDARAILFKDRMCYGCRNFSYYRFYNNGSYCNGDDNWSNYKAGYCPCKEVM